MLQRRLSLALLATLIVSGGCSRDPLGKVRLTGKVTFDDGPCPASGKLVFSPIEIPEGLPNRPGFGRFKADGQYDATSFRPGDGIVPGRYSVGILCFDKSKIGSNPTDADYRAASYVDHDYEPQEVTISRDTSSMEMDFDFPKRDPSAS